MKHTCIDVEFTYLNDKTIQYKFLTDKMSFLFNIFLNLSSDIIALLLANQNR